jgi:hypothetical protein
LLKEVVDLQPGDTVLYHAAAGGVGQIFVQLVRRSFVQGGHPTLPLCTRYFESDERGTYL